MRVILATCVTGLLTSPCLGQTAARHYDKNGNRGRVLDPVAPGRIPIRARRNVSREGWRRLRCKHRCAAATNG